jgi:hypothetical protein
MLAVIFMAMPLTNQARQPAPIERVVFVCEHGSVKSLIASTYFNQRAKARGLAFAAVARGACGSLVRWRSGLLALRHLFMLRGQLPTFLGRRLQIRCDGVAVLRLRGVP